MEKDRGGTTRPSGLFSHSSQADQHGKQAALIAYLMFRRIRPKRGGASPLLSFHAETTQKMKCDHVRLVGFPCPLEGRFGRRAENSGTRHQPAFPRGETNALADLWVLFFNFEIELEKSSWFKGCCVWNSSSFLDQNNLSHSRM